MRELRGEAVGAKERMGEAPDAAFDLAEGLSHPAGEGEFVPVAVNRAVFLPQAVEGRLG